MVENNKIEHEELTKLSLTKLHNSMTSITFTYSWPTFNTF